MLKCPKCSKEIRELKYQTIMLNEDKRTAPGQLQGLAIYCPHTTCGAIVGLQVDSVWLKNIAIEDLLKAQKKR